MNFVGVLVVLQLKLSFEECRYIHLGYISTQFEVAWLWGVNWHCVFLFGWDVV